MPAVFAGTALWAVMVPEGWSHAGIVGVPPLIRLFTIVPAVIACAAQPSSRTPGSNVFSAATRRLRSGCCACAWKRPERRRAADQAGKLRAIACDPSCRCNNSGPGPLSYPTSIVRSDEVAAAFRPAVWFGDLRSSDDQLSVCSPISYPFALAIPPSGRGPASMRSRAHVNSDLSTLRGSARAAPSSI
jgi:hypothetical protein